MDKAWRRGRMHIEPYLVDITPAPALARLDGAHDRMTGGVVVPGCMFILGTVAASDKAAYEAHPQVHPCVAVSQTLLTPLSVCSHGMGKIQMQAFNVHRFL
jgi:hypothetical protein